MLNNEKINKLEKEVEELRFENSILKLIANQDKESEAVLGFKLATKKTKANGKEYEKWYGYAFIGGKTIWIYVGEKEKAEKKIRQWLEKNLDKLEKLCKARKTEEKK